MIISIASGKGGTGKTTIALNLAFSLSSVQLVDCDVEEPNLHLFLPFQADRILPVTLPVPRVDEEVCTHCGKCAEICQFKALAVIKDQVLVFDELCHGCGGCSRLCPWGAIREEDREIGQIHIGSVDGMGLVYGVLNVGEPMAPPVIRRVKQFMAKDKTVIIDCSPGTSCPVVEAVKGSDFCLLATENTPFGLNDLELAVEMVRALQIPLGVFINRSDLGDRGIQEYCHREGIPVLGELPYDRRIAEVYSRGGMIVREIPEYRNHFISLFQGIEGIVKSRSAHGLEKPLCQR